MEQRLFDVMWAVLLLIIAGLILGKGYQNWFETFRNRPLFTFFGILVAVALAAVPIIFSFTLYEHEIAIPILTFREPGLTAQTRDALLMAASITGAVVLFPAMIAVIEISQLEESLEDKAKEVVGRFASFDDRFFTLFFMSNLVLFLGQNPGFLIGESYNQTALTASMSAIGTAVAMIIFNRMLQNSTWASTGMVRAIRIIAICAIAGEVFVQEWVSLVVPR